MRTTLVAQPDVAETSPSAQFLHVCVFRCDNHIRMRPWEDRAMLFQKAHLGVKFNLLVFGEAIPPRLEFIGVFDLPCHGTNITHMEYNVKGISTCCFVRGVSGNSICIDLQGIIDSIAVRSKNSTRFLP